MGSTGSALCERVKSLNEAELSKTSKEDDELALITDELYLPNFIQSLKDISSYEIPILKPRPATLEDSKTEEVKFAFVHQQESRMFDKHEDLRNSLQTELFLMLSKEEDPDFKELCLMLQAICRVQEALIRQKEREQRRVQKSSQSHDEKKKKKPKELPAIARAGMNFCISTMLDLIEIVGSGNRLIYGKVMKSATRVLSDLAPLSLNIEDPTVLENLDYLKEFLENVLKGNCLGTNTEDSLIALAPLFGLALAKGNLSSALSVAEKLLMIQPSPMFDNACSLIIPLFKNLSEIEGSSFGRRTLMNWNTNKLGPDMALSNENLTVTRTDSSGWGCQLTEQSLTSGIHYYEFKVDRNNSSCLLLGVAGSLFANFTSKSSGPHCYTLQADGDAYMNERGSGNIFRYIEGDKIGMLINMEDKTLLFYLNGKKQNKPAFGPLPDEVYLLACFGGANQFVTILNEPDVPEEVQEIIGAHNVGQNPLPRSEEDKNEEEKQAVKEEDFKEGKEILMFPIKPRDIIKASRFKPIIDNLLVQPKELAVYLIACLDKINETYFKIFNLSEKPSSEPIKAKLNKQQPLCLEIKPEIFEMLTKMLQYTVNVLKNMNWEEMDFHLCAWGGMGLLRLLRSHLFTVLYLQLKDEETGITQDLRNLIYKLLQEILELSINSFGLGNPTKEELDALASLKNEACLTLIHGFEVFYPSQVAKLDYINISLEDAKAKKNQFEVYLNIQKLVLDKMSIPVNLFGAFTLEFPGVELKISKLLDLLVDICYEISLQKLKGQKIPDSGYYLKFLHSVQKVIISKAGNDDFKGVWQGLLVLHATKILNLSGKLLQELTPEDIELRGQGTILESLISSLLYSFCLSDTTVKDISAIMPCVMNIVNIINTLNVSTQAPKNTDKHTEVYESNHPYTPANEQKVFKVKSAKKYLLKFDELSCTASEKHVLSLWKNSDKSSDGLLGSWSLNNFPKEFVAETPELHFSFVGDADSQAWGWKITIETEIEKESAVHWIHHLRISSNFLVVFFSKRLITGDFSNKSQTEADKVLKNPLFKFGIKDKCQNILLPNKKPNISDILIDLSMISGSIDSFSPHLSKSSSVVERIRKSSFPGFKTSEINPILTLTSYISNCQNNSVAAKVYSENIIIDEWIRGSKQITEAWTSIKQISGAVGPHYSIGGLDLEQAERTLFAVYSCFFGFSDYLPKLVEVPSVINKNIKELVKQACLIRKWAQHRKQSIIDENKEIDYNIISEEIISKCIILMHSEYHMTFNELGFFKIQTSILPSFRKADFGDLSSERTSLELRKDSSKWRTVKKTVESMSKIRNLLKLVGPVKSHNNEQDDEKKEITKINSFIFEFLETSVPIDKLFEEIDNKRSLGIARTIGINYLIHMYKTSKKEKDLKGQIIRVFSDSFRTAESNRKKHYLSNLEGIDQALQNCVQKSFFSMVSLLLNHLSLKEVKDLDCTSQQATHFYLKIFEALSFPYEEIDTSMLIDLKLHESISFLLRWAKGNSIHENIILKFNKSNCITSFKIHNEEEFQETQHDGIECFSLNTVNRLDGEYEHDPNNSGLRLCLQLIRGEEKILPITGIHSGRTCPEGYEQLDGNINEQGPELFLFVKRTEPHHGLAFLTKLEVIEDGPIVFRPTFTNYDQLLIKQQDQQENEKRTERKKLLKNATWIFLKQFVYTCAGKPEHVYDMASYKEAKKSKLLSMFAELLLNEVAWIKTKERVDRDEADVAKIKLMQVSSGELWMESSLEKPRFTRNPMKEWVWEFRETFSYLINDDETDLLVGLVDGYISELDPTLKGVVECEIEEPEEGLDPNEWKNARGEIDFFVFLNAMIVKNQDEINHDILTHPFMKWIPANIDEANRLYSIEIPVVIQNMQDHIRPNPNDSILKYLNAIKSSSETERLGILQADEIPTGTPADFLTSSKAFDLFATVHTILNNSPRYPQYFEELSPLFYYLKGLPYSLEEIYMPQKTDSSINEYIASVLWVIFQTSCSESMKKVIAKPEFLEVILKHALLGASESVIVIAFRILRSIVPTQHSPQTFSQIWNSIQKDLLEKFLTKDISNDWLKSMLVFIGIRNSYHIKSEKEFIPNLSKLGIWSTEACEFLKVLCVQNRWKNEVINVINTYVTGLADSLDVEKDLLNQELGLGALTFMAMCSASYNPLEKSVQEWSFVSLKGGSLPQGYVISMNKKNKTVSLYNDEDDGIHEESLSHLNHIQSLTKANYFNSLSQESSEELFKSLKKLLGTIKEKGDTIIIDDPEKLHNIKGVWRQFECLIFHILASLTSIKVLFSSAEANEFVDSIFKTVSVADEGDFNENSLKYRALRKYLYSKIKESKLTELKKQENVEIEIRDDKEDEEEEEDTSKKISEEESQKIIGKMNEELQVTVVMLQSIGFSFTDIYAAINAGVTKMEAIQEWIEEKKTQERKNMSESISNNSSNKNIYKLCKEDDVTCQIVDHTGIAHFEESALGQMSIFTRVPLDEIKYIKKKFSNKIFRGVNDFYAEITILSTVGYLKNDISGILLFVIGDLEIKIDSTGIDASIYVGDVYIGSLDKIPNYSFRIHASFDGNVTVEIPGTLLELNTIDYSIYDGITIGDFGVGLQQGEGVILRGLVVCLGHFSNDINYWEDSKSNSADPEDKVSKINDLKPQEQNQTSLRLRTTGASVELCESLALKHVSFDKALNALLQEHTSDDWNDTLETSIDPPIIEVIMCETIEDIEEGYIRVPIYMDGVDITDSYPMDNKKILCYKQSLSPSPPTNVITCVSIKGADENHKDDTDIGNFSKSNEDPIKIWVTKTSRSKLGTKQPLTKIIMIAGSDEKSISIFPGFEVAYLGTKPVNLSSNSDILYLCTSKTSKLLGYPIIPLIYSKVSISEHGLVDALDSSSSDLTNERIKKIDEELQTYSQYSIIELHNHIKHLDKIACNMAMKTFFLQIIQSHPTTLPYLLCKSSDNFAIIYNLLKENLSVLENTIKKVINTDFGENMCRILLHESIFQIILASSCAAPTGKLAEQLVESPHPYENNVRLDQTISIPGAAGLRIEFDSQCHTETGCDILRFYKQPNHIGQICENSGRNFPDFEVEGDTVYLYFYTDSSCVEWGYKFRVIPIESAPRNSSDPLLKRMSVEHAFWILEKIVLSYNVLPYNLHRFNKKELINPLTVYLHTCKETYKQERVLKILQSLLKKPVESTPALQRVVSLITEEVRSLYYIEKNNKAVSSLLQKLIGLITELRGKYHVCLDERWFHDICDAFSLMRGFCNRDENIYPVLFEQFRQSNKIPLEKIRESNHPYSKKCTTKEIVMKGASFLEIEFDEKSKLDIQDAMLFTYDKDGTQPIETGTDASLTDACWSNEWKGPDIVYSNNNRSVTRTNSSGWGCALWSETYSQGRIKINFLIDNDGRSDYLYIGLLKADGNYRLNEVINSDNAHDLWTWKTTGEFHKRTEKTPNTEAKYRTGDVVTLLINMEDRCLTCIKNSIELHTFNDISEEVIPIICFGGSNQHVTVSSVESYIASFSKLSKKKFIVNGDQVFFHFPVNYGYLVMPMHAWKKPVNPAANISFSQDQRKVKTTGAVEGRILQVTGLALQAGRHYIEFLVKKVKDADKLQIGLIPDTSERVGSIIKENTVCYQSNGSVYINNAEKTVDSIKPLDKVGIYMDLEKSLIIIYKNSIEICSSQFNIESTKNYVFAVSFDSDKQEIIILKKPNIPNEIDLLGIHKDILPGAVGKEWGYKFKVTPYFTGQSKMKVVECLTKVQLEKWKAYIDKHLSCISKATEEQLVQYIDEFCTSKKKDPMKLDPEEISPTPQDLRHYRLLEELSVPDLKDMFKIILYFNKQVEKILPLISLDLTSSSRDSLDELQKLFLSTREYIFSTLKNNMFNSVISSTNSDSRPDISVDRTKAMRIKYSGKVDSQAIISLFGQIYRAINSTPPRNFRNHERIFKVVFRGEGATDAGGPYNEAMSAMCDELMSRFLPLFVPTQNNSHNVGENRDAWIINPSADSQLQLDLFQFLGKLMGVAIRTQNNLNLTLPPLFWKRLMLEEVTIHDLKGVDECCCQMLDILRNLQEHDITPEKFSETFENICFSTHDSSGRLVELIERGGEVLVTYERAQEYGQMVENLRLNESEKQYACIRRGMSTVVPLNLLNLFSWKQVESMICGAADIDVEILKSRTEYENINADAPHVRYFWEILKEITPKDRSQFLRFVWGRSRLPMGREFKRFKITQLNKGGNPDTYMPVAHTCFFQIDLPAYTSKDIMKEKFLYAITHCQAIDLDRIADGGWEEDLYQ